MVGGWVGGESSWGMYLWPVPLVYYFCSICRSDPVCVCQPRWWGGGWGVGVGGWGWVHEECICGRFLLYIISVLSVGLIRCVSVSPDGGGGGGDGWGGGWVGGESSWGMYLGLVPLVYYLCSICRSDPVCHCQPRWWVGRVHEECICVVIIQPHTPVILL